MIKNVKTYFWRDPLQWAGFFLLVILGVVFLLIPEELMASKELGLTPTFVLMNTAMVGAILWLQVYLEKRIVRKSAMIEGDQPAGNLQTLGTRLQRIFLGLTIIGAIGSGIVALILGPSIVTAILLGISVLLIATPRTFGLSATWGLRTAMNVSERLGFKFRNQGAIEKIWNLNSIVLGKSKTLSQGKPVVTTILPTPETHLTEHELLRLASAIEQSWDHPIAHAIVEHTKKLGLSFENVRNVEAITSQGLQALRNGKLVRIGSPALLRKLELAIPQSLIGKKDMLEREGKTIVFLSEGKQVLGLIALLDPVRPEAKSAISELQNLGVDVSLLTGDSLQTSSTIANELGIQHVVAEATPEQKLAEIQKLQKQGKVIASIGNFPQADVSIRLTNKTDTGANAVDLSISGHDLENIPRAFEVAKTTIRQIRRHFAIGIIYHMITLSVAGGSVFTGFNFSIPPLMAATISSGFSLLMLISSTQDPI